MNNTDVMLSVFTLPHLHNNTCAFSGKNRFKTRKSPNIKEYHILFPLSQWIFTREGILLSTLLWLWNFMHKFKVKPIFFLKTSM